MKNQPCPTILLQLPSDALHFLLLLSKSLLCGDMPCGDQNGFLRTVQGKVTLEGHTKDFFLKLSRGLSVNLLVLNRNPQGWVGGIPTSRVPSAASISLI